MYYETIYDAIKDSEDFLFRLIRETYLRGVEDGSKATSADDPSLIFHDWAVIEQALEEPCFDPEGFIDTNFNQGRENL